MADLRIRAEVMDENNQPTTIDVNVNLCIITETGIIDGNKDFWPWANPEKSWNNYCQQVWAKTI